MLAYGEKNFSIVARSATTQLRELKTSLYGLSSHQTMRLRGMSEAFQSATSNPSKYRGFQMSKKNFLGPEKFFFRGPKKKLFGAQKVFFRHQALESFKTTCFWGLNNITVLENPYPRDTALACGKFL